MFQNSHFEFCICYQAGEEEFWDSNEGQNFVLEGEPPAPRPASPGPASPVRAASPAAAGDAADECGRRKVPPAKLRAASNDAYRMDYKNWSSFASWKALSTDSPYW